MTVQPAEVFEFAGGDRGRLLERLAAIVSAAEGWVNLHPGVAGDDLPPPRSSLFDVFSGRGPDLVECTVMPGGTTRSGRREPLSIGVRHASGPKAAPRLADAGWAVPSGWTVVQDHPKRGLVATVPDGVPLAEVVDWLLGAGERLSTVATTGWWQARVYR